MQSQTKSLQGRKSQLADVFHQLEVISHIPDTEFSHKLFSNKLKESGLFPLKPKQLEIFQINVGKMCNQVCKHCHVDAGPDRKEIMTKETMHLCLEAIKNSNASLADRSSEAVRIVEEINHLESVVVPEVEIVPEKVVLKKDEISVKKVFSISDEKSFIEWALKNDLSLLQISISKSAFNEWIKKPVNQGYAFIDSKEEII